MLCRRILPESRGKKWRSHSAAAPPAEQNNAAPGGAAQLLDILCSTGLSVILEMPPDRCLCKTAQFMK